MSKGKKKLIIPTILISIIVVVALLMISGILPRQLAGIAASHYAKTNYPDLNLTFNRVEFSSVFGNYFVFFDYGDGQSVAFQMISKIFPILVFYDPLNSPC